MPLRTTKTLIAPNMLSRSMAYPRDKNTFISMRRAPVPGSSENDWTPAALDLAVWLDISDTESIEIVSDKVATITDKSGKGINATQADPAARPTLEANGLNRKSVIALNQTYLDLPTLLLTGADHEVFAVANLTSPVEPWQYGRLFCVAATGEDDWSNPSGAIFVVHKFYSSEVMMFYDELSTDPTVPAAADTFNIYNSRVLPAKIEIVVNANQTNIGSVAAVPNLNTTAGGRIGAGIPLATEYRYWIGKLAEFICTTTLSVSDREKVEGYLAHKWGLASKLPTGHSYKPIAPSII